jgi:hypothetical protein
VRLSGGRIDKKDINNKFLKVYMEKLVFPCIDLLDENVLTFQFDISHTCQNDASKYIYINITYYI